MESKSESKNDDWGAKGESKFDSKDQAGRIPEIDVSSIEVPSDGEDGTKVPLSHELSLKIVYTSDIDVNAHWEVKLLVDCASERVIKVIGETPRERLNKGRNELFFKTGKLDFSGFKASSLGNAGLLMACLVVAGEEIAGVNMVVNVHKAKDGTMSRQILNPLA